MALRQIERDRWHPFLDAVSRSLVGKRAEVEVASLALGDQIEAEWLTLLGIVYEPRKDTIEVALEGLDHMIQRPREIVADEAVFELANITIKDSEGVLHILRLRDPLMLPAPGGAG